MWTSDGNDSRDLGDWIVAQEWSNGKVMTLGASADGIGSLQTSRTNPSWLAAQYVVWATPKIYQTLIPNGAYKQKTAEDWLLDLTMPNPDYVNVNIEIVHLNEKHTSFWDQVELSDEQFNNVRGPSGFWGGWYDIFSMGTIQAFEGYNQLSDPSVRYTSMITIDPLGHCLDSADFWTENAVQGRTAGKLTALLKLLSPCSHRFCSLLVVIGQMFEVYGVIPHTRSQIKNVTFYVMSSNDEAGKAAGQYWTSLETWPVPKMTQYYLHADHTLSTKLPSDEGTKSTSYKHDPADPVPTLGGNNLPDSIGGTIPCGPLDQSTADARSDVLTFQTEFFTEELPLSGGLFATVYVSSDAIDTDFMVKISDVYPTGEARILQDNAVRMRWRER
jgi:putative CocE/NonD family hydrolase